jgi:hypothetical protein
MGGRGGETTLEEMEIKIQLCHRMHHHHPVYSNDHHGMKELESSWETYEYKNDYYAEANN